MSKHSQSLTTGSKFQNLLISGTTCRRRIDSIIKVSNYYSKKVKTFFNGRRMLPLIRILSGYHSTYAWLGSKTKSLSLVQFRSNGLYRGDREPASYCRIFKVATTTLGKYLRAVKEEEGAGVSLNGNQENRLVHSYMEIGWVKW